MPIYEYRCSDCGTEFEELTLSASGQRAVRCRACDGSRVTRMLSAFAVGAADGAAPAEAGPCGACGAPRRGMCAAD
jgi:putative FmdB family regulatory protein